MADLNFTDLTGNNSLLAAVEYLRMLPEWKAKPGKLRTGYVEFAENIAKHLLSRYCELEGKPFLEKMELDVMHNPIAQENEARFALADKEAAFRSYSEKLNAWHLELAIAQKAMEHVFTVVEPEESVGCVAHVLRDRLSQLVDTCPFPGS